MSKKSTEDWRSLSLQELLSKKTITVLKDTARNLGCKSYSGKRKDELVKMVQEALLSPEKLETLLYITNDAAWRCILEAFNKPVLVPTDTDIKEPCKVFAGLGYLQWVESDDGDMVLMPSEIKDIFRQLLESGFLDKKERSNLLDNYAMAATNLYGIISQDDFIALFNQQNEQKTNVSEVFRTLARHIAADAPYCFRDEYLLHYLFEGNNFEDTKSLLQAIQGKPRYIPEKDILLKYADPDYYEKTDVTIRLERFLTPHLKNLPLKISMAPVKEVVSELVFACTVDASIGRILSIFEQYDIKFTKAQAIEAVQIVTDLVNTTRKWSNNGHTPNELKQIRTTSSSLDGRKKIGRNDPCPCGSGKKFKKCCGR